jgi:hypothetical protein
MAKLAESTSPVSQALLSAALGGLLCVAAAGCSASSPQASTGTTTGTGAVVNADTPVPDTTCDGGVLPNRQITSSAVVAGMTLDQFTAQCQAADGILEIQPHCSGSNACRGMSYDSELQTLIQHTCRGLNSCGGFSCVVCD